MIRLPGMDHTSPDAILTDTPAFPLLSFSTGIAEAILLASALSGKKEFPRCRRKLSAPL